MRHRLVLLSAISGALLLVVVGGPAAAASAPRRCSTGRLRADGVFSTGAMDQEVITFRLQNRGLRCELYGYPSVRPLAADGRVVPAREQRTREPFPNGKQIPLRAVVLARGKSVYFKFAYSGFDTKRGRVCKPSAVSVRIIPPGASGRLTVKLRDDMRRFAGLSVSHFSFCGQVFRVGPVEANGRW